MEQEVKTVLDFDVIQKIHNNYVVTRRVDTIDVETEKYEYHVGKIDPSTLDITLIERIGSSRRNAVSISAEQIRLAKACLLNLLPE